MGVEFHVVGQVEVALGDPAADGIQDVFLLGTTTAVLEIEASLRGDVQESDAQQG